MKLNRLLSILLFFLLCCEGCERDPELPIQVLYITTSGVTNITDSTATCGGEIPEVIGISPISACGVCWSISPNPTIADSHTTDGSGIGAYTSNITGLNVGDTYYVRAYATNSLGTTYGEQRSFTTENITHRNALVAFYNATDGPNWLTNTNWCTDANISTWFGVTVTNGFVTGIDLNNNKLSGDISTTLSPISSLRTLDIGNKYNDDNSIYNRVTAIDLSSNTALNRFDCYFNQLTTLDISSNTALTYLDCDFNQLDTLDVSHNTALTTLLCSSNQLTTLDVSHNTVLTHLVCSFNQLTSLDVSHNTTLTYLSCLQNQLTTFDVSHNTSLYYLHCASNQLTTLDISHNTALYYFHCSSNRLTTLDVSANRSLTYLSCYSNQLTTLDINHNTSLTCLQCSFNQLATLDIRDLAELGNGVYVGHQKNSSGDNTYLSLLLDQSQLANKWTPTWSSFSQNVRVNTIVP